MCRRSWRARTSTPKGGRVRSRLDPERACPARVGAVAPLTSCGETMSASEGPLIHDRQLLLHGDKRNQVLELAEIRRYGSDSFADPDYVTIYGLRPDEWHARGVRLLGRTAVELTRDRLAERIGRDIAAAMRGLARSTGTLVIDLFAGSGNTLFWIVRQIAGA